MNNQYITSGRTNQKIETRNKILASAQDFLKKDLEFNLEDIAKKTGISRATIYRYFSNIDVLAAEAALDVSTKSPPTIIENLKGVAFEEQVLGIQDYYNSLALNHENLFRKYISAVLNSNNSAIKRGARRKKTLELILQETDYSKEERENLSNLLTVLMGIEPLIVTKDVCGLNNKESEKLLNWGMELIINGFIASRKNK